MKLASSNPWSLAVAVAKLPDGAEWVYEIKLDGYRALAINDNGKLSLYSRRRKSFNRQYRYIFDALRDLPQNSVVDGEVVSLDDAGRPNFNFLQHSKSQAKRICYFVFDLLVYQNRDLTRLSVYRAPSNHEFCVDVPVAAHSNSSAF